MTFMPCCAVRKLILLRKLLVKINYFRPLIHLLRWRHLVVVDASAQSEVVVGTSNQTHSLLSKVLDHLEVQQTTMLNVKFAASQGILHLNAGVEQIYSTNLYPPQPLFLVQHLRQVIGY
ncbi:hypothetical protein MA16_Dca014062 [Dendrobium catenatum]|uniref:Uncharacterized protein n=1 Tax=Dendrobium catenatum TaxID=906689 RepID=A0A2I0XAE9_9ASPA|nr:hypothetical protein MA16_Dca014062 [Dendrobium catenatum]